MGSDWVWAVEAKNPAQSQQKPNKLGLFSALPFSQKVIRGTLTIFWLVDKGVLKYRGMGLQ